MQIPRVAVAWNRLRSTYWFVPAMLTLSCIGLAIGLVSIDASYPRVAGTLRWVYNGGASGARSLLAAVAGSMITVVSVTFSVTVVALTVSSQHFGPRLLNSFMRDMAAQLVLGTFIGTFAYCVVVLRTVHGEGDGYALFVPHLAVTAGVALTLLSVGMLIYYVHHVSASLQVSEIAHGVATGLERAIARIYPDPIGASADIEDPPAAPPGAFRVPSEVSGYVQEVDATALLRHARAHGVVIWLGARPGDFVIDGSTLALVHPPPADASRFTRGLRDAVVVGRDRTSAQDAGFAVQQLVEVAPRVVARHQRAIHGGYVHRSARTGSCADAGPGRSVAPAAGLRRYAAGRRVPANLPRAVARCARADPRFRRRKPVDRRATAAGHCPAGRAGEA